MDSSQHGKMIRVEINNDQATHTIDEDRLCAGVRQVLQGEGIKEAEISLAVVEDATMQRLNAQYLQHDWPTDVLSFVLSEAGQPLEAEIVVSADYAAATAPRFGWPVADELLLYCIHGALHAAGYDDTTDPARRQMRQREQHYLAHFSLTRPDEQEGARGEGVVPAEPRTMDSRKTNGSAGDSPSHRTSAGGNSL